MLKKHYYRRNKITHKFKGNLSIFHSQSLLTKNMLQLSKYVNNLIQNKGIIGKNFQNLEELGNFFYYQSTCFESKLTGFTF